MATSVVSVKQRSPQPQWLGGFLDLTLPSAIYHSASRLRFVNSREVLKCYDSQPSSSKELVGVRGICHPLTGHCYFPYRAQSLWFRAELFTQGARGSYQSNALHTSREERVFTITIIKPNKLSKLANVTHQCSKSRLAPVVKLC